MTSQVQNENPLAVENDEDVVADKFMWSDLYTKEDWWAIWIGFIIIIAGSLSVITGAFEFKAVKFTTWGNEAVPSLFDAMTSEYFVSLAFTYVVLMVLFTVGAHFMGHDAKKFAIAFTGLFALSWVAYILAAQATLKNYLEYAFWALAVGLLVCNTVGTPEWIKPAIQSEYYVKAGLVVMGAEVLFANITNFGIYGLLISWVGAPLTIIFMWWFGVHFLKMYSKQMVMVIAVATSVCGVSAAIAAAAACGAKKNDLTFAVGLSLLFTILMMIFMPLGIKYIGMDPMIGGAWIGATVDSTGAVVLAGEALGDVGAQVAALIKMIQNILIGFVALAISIFFAMRVDTDDNKNGGKVGVGEIWYRFPKFILGFFAASVVFSFFIMPTFGEETYSAILKTFSNFKGWCFCMTFTAIGLESNFKEMMYYMQGGKPLTLYLVGQTFNVVLALVLCWLVLSGVLLPVPDIATV